MILITNIINISLIILLLTLLFPIALKAQIKDKITNWPEPVFEHITVADGLPENSVFSMIQDRFGYMWLGTQNGLVRYDGYSMKVYTRDPDNSLSISDRTITAIYEDKFGILWVGTAYGGLNRFDRKTETFTRYMHNPDDSTSISNNNVLCINEDTNENILVGTEEGLVLFKKSENTFKHIKKISNNGLITKLNNAVEDILLDSLTGNIYVSGENEILIYDSEKELLMSNQNIPVQENGLGIIHSFYRAKDGAIWIGHTNGLARFNSLRNAIRFFQPFPSGNNNIENNIYQIAEDENGFIWCCNGSWSHESSINPVGLLCFNPLEEDFKSYKADPQNESGISNNLISSIIKDRSGIIWVGTWLGGLNKWDNKKQKFERYKYDSANPKGNLLNGVAALAEDPGGTIWVSTVYGLYNFNYLSGKFKNYERKSEFFTCIYAGDSKTVWIGTTEKGLAKINTAAGTISYHSTNPMDSTTISNNFIISILPEENDILWLGTRESGLYKFYKSTGKFIHYKHDPQNQQSISVDRIISLFKDRSGNFWIGTNTGGLNRFNPIDETFNSFHFTKGIGKTTVMSIYEDKNGNLWVGTYQSGLHLFDRKKEISIYNITEKDGLANNQVMSILEDDSGNLWIGTNNGLSKFNPKTRSIKNFYFPGGIDQNRFYYSAIKTSSGKMLFGTYDGFIMFHPDGIKDDPIPPQVVIGNVSLFNRPGEKLEYESFISELRELNLSYNQNDLRFDYVGLHYGDPSKNKYKYMLEGFDKDWVNAGTQRNAVYTNLNAGEYIFRVKACNLDGVWNEEGASLKIIIPPPFWATWWAYSLYVLFGLVALYSIRRYELNRTQLKNQVKLDEVKLKEREETDKMKSRFFANISHEFRTPLTLILGPIQKWRERSGLINSPALQGGDKESPKKFEGLQSLPTELHKDLTITERNARNLLSLVNQLLDLSKLEAGKLDLKASRANIVPCIRGITMSFESIAERKDITLKVKSSSDEIELYFDKEKMIKIMTNLLSNAFKFTPEGGSVTVSINLPTPRPSKGGDKALFKAPSSGGDLGVGSDIVEISVRDTGFGISEDELPKLFDRFYQVDSSQTREHEGTGIGLALTKELVELHHGTIMVTSEISVGTEFTVRLPVGRKHLKDDEIVEEEVSTDEVILNGVKNLLEINETDSSHFDRLSVTDNGGEDRNIILVVEDNADVREYIKDSLGDNYQVEEAVNGEQGVRKAEQIIPDLIISDIMMPKMDGNELTKRLKNDEKTSHIPIILLTAKSEQESKLEGLETGADDYLTKPFDTKELRIRINNLIRIRRKLQERYSKGDFVSIKRTEENLSQPVEDKAEKLSDLEEQFMCKVMEVIENHLSEEEFSPEQFAKELYMSRMQLHRKLKALTGKSTSLYVRYFKLLKAKKMIEEKQGNVSEIAYSFGFSSPAYFTKCFKEEFGIPPSELTG